jgi:hypothetical protein
MAVTLQLTLAVMVAGCNLQRTAAEISAPIAKRGSRALASQDDVEFARAAVPGLIMTAEGLLETIPDNRDTLEAAANGCIQYAFGFLEDDLESTTDPDAERVVRARAVALYDRALGYALHHLATFDSGFAPAFLAGGAALEHALAGLPKPAVPGIAYAGIALASAINLARSDPSRLVDLPKAVQLLERARSLDPGFAAGIVPMVLGIIYAQRPELGGRPDRAKVYFDQAIAVTRGQYLMSRVMSARGYQVAVRDRAQFESLLQQVVTTSTQDLPAEFRLANEMAKRRAARYLRQADVLF